MFAESTFQTSATWGTAAVHLQSVSRHAARIVALLAREFRIRRDIGLLAEFDDAMLHDIGLSRAEIEPALRHGRAFRRVTATNAR